MFNAEAQREGFHHPLRNSHFDSTPLRFSDFRYIFSKLARSLAHDFGICVSTFSNS